MKALREATAEAQAKVIQTPGGKIYLEVFIDGGLLWDKEITFDSQLSRWAKELLEGEK